MWLVAKFIGSAPPKWLTRSTGKAATKASEAGSSACSLIRFDMMVQQHRYSGRQYPSHLPIKETNERAKRCSRKQRPRKKLFSAQSGGAAHRSRSVQPRRSAARPRSLHTQPLGRAGSSADRVRAQPSLPCAGCTQAILRMRRSRPSMCTLSRPMPRINRRGRLGA